MHAHSIGTLRRDVRAAYNTGMDGAVQQDGLIDEVRCLEGGCSSPLLAPSDTGAARPQPA